MASLEWPPKVDRIVAHEDAHVHGTSTHFEVTILYEFGCARIVCKRCGREAAFLRQNPEGSAPNETKPLMDLLAAHRCGKLTEK
jgi:hypothetical protein